MVQALHKVLVRTINGRKIPRIFIHSLINPKQMNIGKSLLKRLGIMVGSVVLLPIIATILIALIGLGVPVFIIACFIVALTASDDQIKDCFSMEVDSDMVLD